MYLITLVELVNKINKREKKCMAGMKSRSFVWEGGGLSYGEEWNFEKNKSY